jgi:hypothetical protein
MIGEDVGDGVDAAAGLHHSAVEQPLIDAVAHVRGGDEAWYFAKLTKKYAEEMESAGHRTAMTVTSVFFSLITGDFVAQ